MHRTALFVAILLVIAHVVASAQSPIGTDDPVLSRCPTLARLYRSGQLDWLKNPVLEDEQTARKFGRDCAKVVTELDALLVLPSDYAVLRRRAALAAEFLTGDVYLLSTTKVRSVYKLREWVKIPPPPGFVYVKKYSSTSAMPPEVAEAFSSLSGSQGAKVRGVTIQGRYIALLVGQYHDELADNLAHELVHAYLTLASPAELPRWFQEGAAVYFSTGKESRLYGKTGDPKMMQVTIPEDYKTKLYSFQHIEKKVGRKKLFEFVRQSVETGRVDARKALGLGPVKEERRKSPPIALFVGVGIAVVLLIVWLISRRDEGWAM